MKHHHHSIGWRRANRHDIPAWKEIAALGACYAIVIGMTVFVVHVFCMPV